jgi:hypothetical protein
MVSLVQKLAAIETEVDINFRKKIRKLNHQYNDISSYLKVGDDGKLVSVKKEPIKPEVDSTHGKHRSPCCT